MTNKTIRAIIVAIENYRFEKISKVKHALNDANAFKDLLIENFGAKPENVKLFPDNLASKTALQEELTYEIRNLTEEDKFIFYYVGHGFYADGTNKLTAYDTSSTNLLDTTLSLREILINPLKDSNCDTSLIFLDTCSKYITENIVSRDAISNINNKELEFLLRQTKFSATYMSCSPGEKSYSDNNLQHGIWTFHLLEALKGNHKEILTENKYITDSALRDYLNRSVPKFITEKTDIRESQTPYANLLSSNSFIIHEVPEEEEEKEINNELPSIKINFGEIKLNNWQTINVKEGSGFKSSHFPPDKVGASGEHFIRKAFEKETSDEIQNVYNRSKEILGLRRKEIKKEIQLEGGFIHTTLFKFDVSIEQNKEYPAYAQYNRELTILDYGELTYEFDEIFNLKLNKFIVDCEITEEDFEDLVERFENLAEEKNGKLEDDDRYFTLTYTTIDGLKLFMNLHKKKILISTERNYRINDFLSRTEDLLNQISTEIINFNK
nr:caspase family protein [uncultured Draconibacterium sp.]